MTFWQMAGINDKMHNTLRYVFSEVFMKSSQFEQACTLFNTQEFFEAHEVWEDLWNEAQGERHAYLQGLIQVAAALVHAKRGNWRGVHKLFASALQYLERGRSSASLGEVDPAALREKVLDFELSVQEVEAGKMDSETLVFFQLPRL